MLSKSSQLLLSDYIQEPNEGNLVVFINSIGNIEMSKSSKKQVMLLIDKYKNETVEGNKKIRLQGIEGYVKSLNATATTPKRSTKAGKVEEPEIRILDEVKERPVTAEDQQSYEKLMIINNLGDWTDKNSMAWELLHGNKGVLSVNSTVDMDLLLGSDNLVWTPARQYKLNHYEGDTKKEGWLEKYSGVKPRRLYAVCNLNSTMTAGYVNYTLSSYAVGSVFKTLDVNTKQEVNVPFERIVSGAGVGSSENDFNT